MLIKTIVSAVMFPLISVAMTVLPATPLAAQQTLSYSATALHARAGQPETTGTVVKSGQNMRLEFVSEGQNIIQILRPEIGAMYILDPAARTYMEVIGPAVPATATDAYTNPCPGQIESPSCQRSGTDTVNGIAVERWNLSTAPNTAPTVLLWDSTRRRALRQETPDGAKMIMSFQSMRDLNGRRTEYWTTQTTIPGQPVANGDWWFDPELRVVVRETLANGDTRRLENIVVGAVNPTAFQVPQGWQKIELPNTQLPAPTRD
ncbi:MAG: hypothetical protein Q9M48_09300 [Rhodobacterales bacterium]|nr:hypothetical protein [Rhodobacterales bacterium]